MRDLPPGFVPLDEFLDELVQSLPWHVRLMMPFYRWKVRREIRARRS